MREIVLSTGKKIGIREKKGQHRLIENRLLKITGNDGTIGDDGMSYGSMLGLLTIQAIVSIESIDGKIVNVPTDLASVYELTDRFTYEEWNEYEKKVRSSEDTAKLEAAAKNLQTNTGSEIESNSPLHLEPVLDFQKA